MLHILVSLSHLQYFCFRKSHCYKGETILFSICDNRDNIKIDLLEIGRGGVDWIGLAQDRDKWRALVNAVMNLRVP
jgi:hypothetical protein